MNIFESMSKIDRRIIYLILFIVATVPFLFKVEIPMKPTSDVVEAYDFINSLPEGSAVIISADYDASSMPELQPMLVAILRQLFSRNMRVLVMSHWALGVPLAQKAVEEVASEYGKKYGVDYVVLGYRPGLQAVMISMGKDIPKTFDNVDYKNRPLKDMPVMHGIKNYDDIGVIIGFEAGSVGDMWAQFANARYGARIILGSTAVVAPDLYPYKQAGQIIAVLGGLRAAADYENLVHHKGTATYGMTTQAFVHFLIIAFIILGNIGYIATQRKRRS